MRASESRLVRSILVAALVAGVLVPVVIRSLPAAALPPVMVENALPGNPPVEWDVVGAGDPSLQGFTTDISVDQGSVVEFKVGDPAGGTERDPVAPADFRIDVYRLGYYGGNGARLVATVPATATAELDPPGCAEEPSTGLIDCGTWPVAATWSVPADATSGVYIGRLVREDTGGASHVTFVVRDDDGASDIVFQTSDTTWHAYNSYGGNSLYGGTGPGTGGSSDGRAYAVSYNRPLTVRGSVPEDSLFNAEYPAIRWLERNGYDVSYTTGIDTHRAGPELLEHDVFLSVGHDEYWSGPQRANVEAARDDGVNLAFFSGNEVFWRTRLAPSIEAAGTPNRTLVSYKETHNYPNNADPTTEWTGTWRDPRDPESISAPENSLTGTIFTVNCCTYDMTVPADAGLLRLWRNSSVASSPGDDTLRSGILGYEWDEDLDNGSRPAGQIRLSSTTVDVPQRVVDASHGSSFAPGTATHSLTLHRAASGALVFGAGTVQWSWGLDEIHDRGGVPAIPAVQQATVNLLADMGAQPATLQADLVAATASTDTSPPTSTITTPSAGGTVPAGSLITVDGTSTDDDGAVGGVEVTTDGGASWHPANGRDAWSYTFPTPTGVGESISINVRATDDSGNSETPGTPVTVTTAPRSCPCTLFGDQTPTPNAPGNDPDGIEVGLKFQATEAGYVTGVRFYKFAQNIGTHHGRLWDASGNKLAQVTFAGESATGWQQASFDVPVAVEADTTYVVSYLAPSGHYGFSASAFASNGLENPPLRAIQSGAASGAAGNGVYRYAGSCPDTVAGCFPNESYNSSNYWVDVVFDQSGVDATAPTVTTVEPADDAARVDPAAVVSATFSERIDITTLTSASVTLTGPNGAVPAALTYDDTTRRVTLTPTAPLEAATTFTATIIGGTGGVADTSGNVLSEDVTWSFTTMLDLEQGPGGPILVVADAADPFGFYLAEILRAEGFNEFDTAETDAVDETFLADYDVVIVAPTTLTASQVAVLTSWVDGGGNLIALRPDPQLASLLGVVPGGGTLTEGHLRIDTASAPGAGLAGESLRYHGTADLYTLDGAREVATLYSDATTPTIHPAVTVRDVGTVGGQAAAFTFDLARSVVATRQGNSAWAGVNGDGNSGPARADDMFHNGTDPDWVNLDNVDIPQADEQQRLLVNVITEFTRDAMPLPRLWYFPRGDRAVVVMTMDEHGGGDLPGRLDTYLTADPTGCSVDDWECVRSTAYIYPDAPITATALAAYQAQGFEFSLHTNTGCQNASSQALALAYTSQLASLEAAFPGIEASRTNRTHCIAWSDWAGQPTTQLDVGIRLDTNYYYWPADWIQDRPGMFTGSGMPMRFADLDGTMIDVYQAATQMTDESGQSFPATIDALLDKALGPEGYYGAFVANPHTDGGANANAMAAAIVASAQARDVSVISAEQLLEWTDGRNASSFEQFSWDGSMLEFAVSAGTGARGLTSMVPATTDAGSITELTLDGAPVAYDLEIVKGVQYAMFTVANGTYAASYAPDNTAPTVSSTTPSVGAIDVALDAPVTATFSEPVDAATVTSTAVTLTGPTGSVAASIGYDAGVATATLTPNAPLVPLTTYTVSISGVEDSSGNPMTAPFSWSFTTTAGPACPCSIFGSTGGGAAFNDGQAIETGVRFQTDVDGLISTVRFYKANPAGAQFTGHLWTNSGTLLGSGTINLDSGTTGWQEVPLSTPIAVNADTTYVASVLSPSGDYTATGSGLVTGVDTPPVRALANGEDGPNGVYRYGGGFPTDTFGSANYWIDVSFTIPDTVAPAVVGRSPAVGALDVDPGTNVVVTFSEAVDPTTVTTGSVRLRAAGALDDVAATVSSNGATVTLEPSAPLASGTQYTATVDGSVTDLAGNPLATDVTWSFTIATTCGVQVPGALGWWAGSSNLAAEVGPDLDGTVAYGPGVVGQGLVLDGTQTVSVDGFPAVTDGVTVEAWVKPTADDNRIQALFTRWDFPSTDDAARAFSLMLAPGGQLIWETDETSTRRPEVLVASASQLFDGDFHHVAATWDRSRTVILVDGVEVASARSQGGTLNATPTVALRIGSKSGIGNPFFFAGTIDEPSVYGRALASSEVAAIHAAGSDGKCP